jgi:hypothetical protein
MEAVQIDNAKTDQNTTLDMKRPNEHHVEGARQTDDLLDENVIAPESHSEAAATEMTSPEPSNVSLPPEVISYYSYELFFNTEIMFF